GPAMMRFEDSAIARDRLAEQRIAREDHCRGADLPLQLAGEGRRDQAPEALGRAQAHEPAQFRHQPVAGAANPGSDRCCRHHANCGPMGERAVDELRQVDPGNADHENPETAHGDPEWRREAMGWQRHEAGLRGDRQAEIEPADLLGLDDARTQPLLDRLRFSRHARRFSSYVKRVIEDDRGVAAGYCGPLRIEAGWPGNLMRCPVSVRVVPSTFRTDRSPSMKLPT